MPRRPSSSGRAGSAQRALRALRYSERCGAHALGELCCSARPAASTGQQLREVALAHPSPNWLLPSLVPVFVFFALLLLLLSLCSYYGGSYESLPLSAIWHNPQLPRARSSSTISVDLPFPSLVRAPWRALRASRQSKRWRERGGSPRCLRALPVPSCRPRAAGRRPLTDVHWGRPLPPNWNPRSMQYLHPPIRDPETPAEAMQTTRHAYTQRVAFPLQTTGTHGTGTTR